MGIKTFKLRLKFTKRVSNEKQGDDIFLASFLYFLQSVYLSISANLSWVFVRIVENKKIFCKKQQESLNLGPSASQFLVSSENSWLPFCSSYASPQTHPRALWQRMQLYPLLSIRSNDL